MQKKLVLWGLSLFFCFFFCAKTTSASLFEPNNKVGIGMAGLDDEGIIEASNMVNGGGGAWGYVTLVIPENDRDVSKWQSVCDKLRFARLIPIFRLATRSENGSWRRPDKEGAGEWAGFLNRLNCTTKTTYIVLFNEPDHASEWGGAVDVPNYAETTMFFAQTLKNTNPNFFVMPAGLDQATPHQPPNYYDAERFWQEVMQAQPNYFDSFDGLAVHCYNRGFSIQGFKENGRSSIRCYEWELNILSSLGVKKELPIFITETGWTGGSPQLIASAYRHAYEQVWLPDGRVRAVTPFILSYIGPPFEPFSFKKTGDNNGDVKYHDQYYAVRDIAKVQGDPPHTERVNVLSPLPTTLIKESTYQFQLWLRNAGQSIWHKSNGYTIDFVNKPATAYSFSSLYNVEPNDSTIINLSLTVGSDIGGRDMSIGLFKGTELKSVLFPWKTEVIAPVPMSISLSVFPGKVYDGLSTIQFFDARNKLVFEQKDVRFVKGKGMISEMKGISIGQQYRVVALADFYLPRQENVVIERENNATFEMLIPGDANNDGKFSIEDVFLMPVSRPLFRSFLPALLKPNLQALRLSSL